MNTLNLPSLSPVPDDIAEHLQRLLQSPGNPALENWLAELLREANHIGSAEALRWRTLAMVWLAAEFDSEKAWPYLMWFNMNQPEIGEQVAELLTEAVDEFGCHLQLAYWLAHTTDDRLKTFFTPYKNVPAARQLPPLMDWLFAHPHDERTGTFLAGFCRDTAGHPAPTLRGWRVLAAIWLAANFSPADGLESLQEFLSDGVLSAESTLALNGILHENHRRDTVRLWVAECPDETVRKTIRPLLLPDVPDQLELPPDFGTPDVSAARAAADAAAHHQVMTRLQQAGIDVADSRLLTVGGGTIMPDAALFGGKNVRVTAVDSVVPPKFIPADGVKAKFRRAKLNGAWKSATAEYYHTLAGESGIKPGWKTVSAIPADAAAIPLLNATADAVICRDFLPHFPDVPGALAEISRILAPNGVLVAEIVPFTALNGAGNAHPESTPWAHLQNDAVPTSKWANRWRLSQYQAALVEHFEIVDWHIEKDSRAAQLLSPKLANLLEIYSPEELTAARVWVIALKR